MKRNNLLITLALLITILYINNNVYSQNKSDSTQKKNQNKTSEIEKEKPAPTIVEQMPEFPGGQIGLSKFLSNNIKYPDYARESGIQGNVYVTFVVKTDGSISNIKILRGIGGGCDEEVIRVIKKMPNWKPGKQDGKNVNVQFNLPVNFRLNDDDNDKKNKKKKRFIFF